MSNLIVNDTDVRELLAFCLQKELVLSVSNKVLKRGKLILFKRVHFFIQLTFMNSKGTQENIEIPIPFAVEDHLTEGLLFFDYRIQALRVSSLPTLPSKVSSSCFNKILELSVVS